MRLWGVPLFLALAAGCYADTVRGKLVQRPGKPAAVETGAGKLVELDGDKETRAVLEDRRLAGFELEAKGRFAAPERFRVDGLHTRAMFVFKDGNARLITYWCDVCSIRTYTPGICWCCQQETTLDLRDPNAPL
ncbi:MAG: hypothetical protein ACE15B_22825 [Bryobacteraceae bacterium]